MIEKAARDLSDFLSNIILGGVLILIGFQIPDVKNTLYAEIIGGLFIYSAIGSLIMRAKNIYPNASARIVAGRVDIYWGFLVQYWSLWWPAYLSLDKNARH